MKTVNITRNSGHVDTLNLYDEGHNGYKVPQRPGEVRWLTPAQAEAQRGELAHGPDAQLVFHTSYSLFVAPGGKGAPAVDFTVEWPQVGWFKDMEHIRWHIAEFTYDAIVKEEVRG